MKPLLTLEEAQSRLLALAQPLAAEDIPVEMAAGRYLARELLALRSQPTHPLSAMDGWAVRQADMTMRAPGPWQIIGESAAGHPFAGTIGPGEAARIATGAIVPEGADMVLVQEDCRREGETLHFAGIPPKPPARHIRREGNDFIEGTLIAAAGARLGPVGLALAITAGHASVPVRRAARIAVIEGGDELRAPGESLPPGTIPASNGIMLAAMLRAEGCETRRIGPVVDRREALIAAFEQALSADAPSDLVITSGGASVGDHDLILPVLRDMGAEIDFWRVGIKPGKPIMVARVGDTPVIGLPGNPVSSYVTATLFALPMVRAMMGAASPLPVTSTAICTKPLPATGTRTEFLRGAFTADGVIPIPQQDSAALSALATADALILRPAGSAAANAGSIVTVYPIGDHRSRWR